MSFLSSTIFISGLRLQVIIGIYPEERLHSQEIQLDIEIGFDINLSLGSDQIEHTINYAKLVERVQHWAQKSQFYLVESLANFLVNKLLEEFPIQKLKLKLSKFPRDIPAESVGVIVEREA